MNILITKKIIVSIILTIMLITTVNPVFAATKTSTEGLLTSCFRIITKGALETLKIGSELFSTFLKTPPPMTPPTSTSIKTKVTVNSDSIINTSQSGALPAISKEELQYILKKRTSIYTSARQKNMNVDKIIEVQNTYKINALYILAVGTWESGWGTGVRNKNIFSIKNSAGKYKTYANYNESIQNFGTLLSGTKYFGGNLYTIKEVSAKFKTGNVNDTEETTETYINNIVKQMNNDYKIVYEGYQKGEI